MSHPTTPTDPAVSDTTVVTIDEVLVIMMLEGGHTAGNRAIPLLRTARRRLRDHLPDDVDFSTYLPAEEVDDIIDGATRYGALDLFEF